MGNAPPLSIIQHHYAQKPVLTCQLPKWNASYLQEKT